MYKFAAQNRLRFSSPRGQLTVEDLFQLPLKSKTGLDLDTVAKNINSQLRQASEESFVEDSSADPQRKLLDTALEIVKDVIKTKQDENKAHMAKLKKAEQRRKILDAIGAKSDEAISKASLEDLEKQLAALEADSGI